MFQRVKVKKSALDYFRTKAREEAPLECQAYLAGKVNSIDEIEIVKFLYTTNYAKQTTWEVQWFVDDYNKIKEKVEAEGLRVVGSVHTHPNVDAVLSKADYDAHIQEQLAICGIVSVRKNKTKVRFWTPHSALPCTIIYS